MKCNPERLEIATRYAKQNGFQGASYLLDWFDYSVFTPLFRDNVVHYIGKPIFMGQCKKYVVKLSAKLRNFAE